MSKIVRGLSNDGKTQVVERLETLTIAHSDSGTVEPGNILGMYLDVETTGIDSEKDKIIDLAYIVLEVEKETGRIVAINSL